MSLQFQTLTGGDIAPVIDDVAALRIRVFRDWPYLYDGDLDYERAYLHRYQQSNRAMVVTAGQTGQLVGAATGLPLCDADPEFQEAFAGTGLDLSRIFYCAESVLLPGFRGQGAGHRFFDLREAHAVALGFDHIAFCSVLRPADHPLRPDDYRLLDSFWRKRGYAPLDGVFAKFSWRDLGADTETKKSLQFWMRKT